jgi:hypothetical protein
MMGRWLQQIVTIENKGTDAFRQGKPLTANPYLGGYRNQNGAGGSVQRQRRAAWERGWKMAAADEQK